MNLHERLDRENWATTMVLLPKAHICSSAQHWAGDFCPSVPQHSPIFKLITMTAIISAGHSGGLICWTSHKGENTNYVFHWHYNNAADVDAVEKLKKCGLSTSISSTVSLGSNYVFLHVCWTNSTSRLDIIAFVWRQMNMLTFQYSWIE